MLRQLQKSTATWIRTNWRFDPLVVIAMPLVLMFYVAALVGPLVVVLLWDRPPLVLGIAAALLGVSVVSWMVVEGFNARFLALASRGAGGTVPSLHADSWALVARAVFATAWLVPVVGIWSAAIENEFRPTGAAFASDYARLALWQVGDTIPLVNVPRTLGYPMAPVSTWGFGTGIALVILSLFVVYSILLVVAELVSNRGSFTDGT